MKSGIVLGKAPQPIRDRTGRFAKRGYAISTTVVIVILGSLFATATFIPVTREVSFSVPTASAAVVTVSLDQKVAALKNHLLDEMVACENPSHLLVWPDDNQVGSLPRKDKVSIGDMAFKLSTVQRFYEQLNGRHLSDAEALQIALDPKQARELAIEAWINLKGSINEWSCVTPTMKTQVEDIRFLTL